MHESHDDRMVGLAHALDAAVRVARSGDIWAARCKCSAIILDNLPLLACRDELLTRTLYVLLVCRCFGLLSRVVMAIQGSTVAVTVAPDNGQVKPPGGHVERRRMHLLVELRWLDDLSPDDPFLRVWSRTLIAASRPGRSDTQR